MPTIDHKNLHRRFSEHIEKSNRIDIAVAWIRACRELNALIECKIPIRIVVGVSKNWTDPSVLKRLAEASHISVRIVPNKAVGLFHPKYYSFHCQPTIHWIGSANLTPGGFGTNEELVHEFIDELGETSMWFERLWSKLETDPWPAIKDYDDNYVPPSASRRSSGGPKVRKTDLLTLNDINTWKDFVKGLREYDTYYSQNQPPVSVLGETHSWLHTIRTGHEIVQRSHWAELSELEYDVLAPSFLKEREGGVWGALGSVRGGGAYLLNPVNMPEVKLDRNRVRQHLGRVLDAPADDIVNVAHDVLQQIWHSRFKKDKDIGIGPAAATRWLALARPDYLVSVNSKSAPGLGALSGLSTNHTSLAKRYDDLLKWIHDQPWYFEVEESEIDDPLELDIWHRRAALLDVFVYPVGHLVM